MAKACLLCLSSWLALAVYCSAGEPTNQASDAPLSRFTFTEPHMGTRFKIILYAKNDATANRAAKAAFARIADLDGIMSDYRSTSELMRLCQKSGGKPVPVSDDLFRVLSRAQEVSKLSDGAFDVTIGPVVRLWRRARRTHELPDPKELAQARELVGYQNVRLDSKNQTVQLLKAGMRLDLGGIGKGYAADAALATLREHGITRGLVAAGGDIAVSGPPPLPALPPRVGEGEGGGWTIGIAPLEDPDAKPKRYLILHDAAVSTSGDAEQYLEIGGKRYSHILDPKTGLGLTDRLSVTVVAPKGLVADPLTKVISVLGPERGLAIIDTLDGVAALVVRKTDKGLETLESKRFSQLPSMKDAKRHE